MLYAVTQPEHVAVNELFVRPVDQIWLHSSCGYRLVDCGAGRGEQVRDLWFAEGVALCLLLLLESAVRAGQPALVLAEVLRPVPTR